MSHGRQRGAEALALALPLLHGLRHFLAVGVIAHLLGVLFIIKEDFPILGNPRDPVIFSLQFLQVLDSAGTDPSRGQVSL